MEEGEPAFRARKMCFFPENYSPNVTALKRALSLITEAMDFLDAHRGPPSAAGHLAVAGQTVCRDLMSLDL